MKKINLLFSFLLSLFIPVVAFAHGGGDGGGKGGNLLNKLNIIGFQYRGTMTLLIGLLFLVAFIFFIVQQVKVQKKEPPIEIVKKRYAKGEITKQEFENIKKDLLAS